VNPPQCAILGVGRIVDKPVAVAGAVEVRPSMWLSLTFDHQIVDGAPAARFLQQLGDRLASPG
jgi:pyruvate dehydrogenase E2 component (dihydrolipoamide acetyltransferase)